MADRLTSDQFTAFSGHVMEEKVTRTVTIDNSEISATDISTRIKLWGKLKTELYNKHPDDRAALRFPVMTLTADNSGGYFNRGGVIFPNGNDDFASTTIRVQVVASGTTWLDFTGVLREPEYTGRKMIDLVADHPLVVITSREWVREDRIGGDTGLNASFNS